MVILVFLLNSSFAFFQQEQNFRMNELALKQHRLYLKGKKDGTAYYHHFFPQAAPTIFELHTHSARDREIVGAQSTLYLITK